MFEVLRISTTRRIRWTILYPSSRLYPQPFMFPALSTFPHYSQPARVDTNKFQGAVQLVADGPSFKINLSRPG